MARTAAATGPLDRLVIEASIGPLTVPNTVARAMENPRRTRDPRQTEDLGGELAATLLPGDVVLVAGELGAGKTTFVRGGCQPGRCRVRSASDERYFR